MIMGEDINSKSKLFSSLSKLQDNSVEISETPVESTDSENRMFGLFCVVASLAGVASLVLLKVFKDDLNVLAFSVLFMVMVLFLPAIAMCGMLKTMISGESVRKHITTTVVLMSIILTIVVIQVATVNADIFRNFSVGGIVSRDQVWITLVEVGLSMLAGVVLLVLKYRKKWHLALVSFLVFWIAIVLIVNIAMFFKWFA